MASHQQFFPMCIIHVCNVIFLVKYAQIMSFVGVLQTIVLTLTLGLLQSAKEPQQRANCEIGIVWHNSFNWILNKYLILVSMGYHPYKSNRQLSKPRNHFVTHLEPWKNSFVWSILSWITHKNSSFDWTDFVLHVW